MTQVATTDSLTCTLEGATCAGCIAKIEALLNRQNGVILARGNASLKRIRLVWDPALQSPESLIRMIGDAGYKAYPFLAGTAAPKEPMLLPHLGVAAFCMMNIMVLSFSVWTGHATDMGPGSVQFMHWISAALATPVVLYSASVFYLPSLRALKKTAMTMDTPISLAIMITYAASLAEVLRGAPHVYFDAVVSLVFFLLIGRVLERSLKRRSDDAAANLRQLMNTRAQRQTAAGTLEDIDANALARGDVVVVETGERVPADAVLMSDTSQIDESIITGETLPRTLSRHDAIVAGSIVYAGPAVMRVTHVGDDAQIGQITRMIDIASTHKSRSQLLADQFAAGYIPIVLIGGLAGFALWYLLLGASFADAVMVAVAVLVVTCPCAAGLATPAVSSRAVNHLMKIGIVVKSGDALERLGDATSVISDKTGTLSTPLPVLVDTRHTLELHQASRLAAASRHPLAAALCQDRNAQPLDGLVEVPGHGMKAPDGSRLGSAGFVGASGKAVDGPALWFRSAEGKTTRFDFSEAPRPETEGFLIGLRDLDIPVCLLSGDTPRSVRKFARQIGVPEWRGGAQPQDKLDVLRAAKASGDKPIMFGDGINDAPALSAAHVSVSFASATQVAQVAADVVLTRPAPDLLPVAIRIARKSRALILQNLRFSATYNVVTVPLALAGYLSPMIAAILMSTSSIIVLANGLRLKVPE
ncbi:cadmium-translocating P-type ATPase [Roseobacter sp. YSTF-M11]|uniref:Cadmium-translocating P-type ATPase n=1 Tax=Roseobacter insulae TaxID=2859783 RepID=A0A9X1JXN5_9RHOB|nr:cation-translocating P-type ATPase [Roseobacter insulae]MBW4707460.1 cadmium-translocating P-type ATPase [Roseobacter insulae]